MRRVVGQCTACGACCRFLALPLPADWPESLWRKGVLPLTVKSPEFRYFLEVRGCRVGRHLVGITHQGAWRGLYSGVPVVYFRSTCPHLQEDGRCGLYGKPERPVVCERWPQPTDDLAVVADV